MRSKPKTYFQFYIHIIPPHFVPEGIGLPHESATLCSFCISISWSIWLVKWLHTHATSAFFISSQHFLEGFIWGPDLLTYTPHSFMRPPMPEHCPTTTSPHNTITPTIPKIITHLLLIVLSIFLHLFSSECLGVRIGGVLILLCCASSRESKEARTWIRIIKTMRSQSLLLLRNGTLSHSSLRFFCYMHIINAKYVFDYYLKSSMHHYLMIILNLVCIFCWENLFFKLKGYSFKYKLQV